MSNPAHERSTEQGPVNVLITGCDNGIGLEFCRQVSGHANTHVIAGCKCPESATSLQALAKEANRQICIRKLDYCNDSDFKALADEMTSKNTSLDQLILNAGIVEEEHPNVNASDASREELLRLFDVNVVGTHQTIKYFLPFVKKSETKKIIGITTGMASMEKVEEKEYLSAPYRVSKAAENMLLRCWTRDPTAHGTTFILLHPGHVDTEMGKAGGRTPPMSVQDGVRHSLEVICKAGIQDNGRFFNYDGTEIPF